MKTLFYKTKPYHLLVLGIVFLVFVIAQFLSAAPEAHRLPAPNAAPVAAAQADGFVPDASNVSSATSRQLEDLRLRVVNAPDDTAHVFRLARLLHDSHKLEEAARNYKHYLAMRPQNRQAWLDYARSLGEQQNWESAETAAKDMLRHYPDDIAGKYNLGAVYANQSRFEDASTLWHDVAAQQQDTAMATMATASLQRLNAFVKPQWARK